MLNIIFSTNQPLHKIINAPTSIENEKKMYVADVAKADNTSPRPFMRPRVKVTLRQPNSSTRGSTRKLPK